jgi:hypothetical protein
MVDTVNSVNAPAVSRFTSRAEFARRARVSRAAVTKACRGPLAAALVERIDLEHPAAVAYLQRSRAEVAGAPPPPPLTILRREVWLAHRRLTIALAAYDRAASSALPAPPGLPHHDGESEGDHGHENVLDGVTTGPGHEREQAVHQSEADEEHGADAPVLPRVGPESASASRVTQHASNVAHDAEVSR